MLYCQWLYYDFRLNISSKIVNLVISCTIYYCKNIFTIIFIIHFFTRLFMTVLIHHLLLLFWKVCFNVFLYLFRKTFRCNWLWVSLLNWNDQHNRPFCALFYRPYFLWLDNLIERDTAIRVVFTVIAFIRWVIMNFSTN